MKIYNYLLPLLLLGLINHIKAQGLPQYISKDSLIGWWPFNGNANDESGHNNHGKIKGAILTADRYGISNNAYEMNGTAPGISVDSLRIRSLNFTLSYWVKYQSSPSTSIISDISHDWYKLGSFHVYRDSNNNIVVATPYYSPDWERYSKKTGNDSTEPLNQWLNIVIVRSGLKISLYKNGQFISTINNPSSRGYITQNLYFGGDPTNFALDTNAKFNGIMDDIGLWNRSLSQQEIRDLYSSCNLTILQQPSNQTADVLSTATFSVLVSDTNTTYQWQAEDKGSGFINIESYDPNFIGGKTPTLIVKPVVPDFDKMKFRCILNLRPCIDTTQIVELNVKESTNLNPIPNSQVSIYPNPSSNQITLSTIDSIDKSYILYDFQGKSVLNGSITSDAMVIKINHLPEGMYWIKIGENVMKKISILQ